MTANQQRPRERTWSNQPGNFSSRQVAA